MIKFLRFLLVGSLVFNCLVFSKSPLNVLFSNKRPFYKNVSQKFVDTRTDVFERMVDVNSSHKTLESVIFHWNQYADSWEEFQANYDELELKIEMQIDFNKGKNNIKWKQNMLKIPLKNITLDSMNWKSIIQINEKTMQTDCYEMTHAELFYCCWIKHINVLIKFQLKSWAKNNIDTYFYTINTQKINCRTNFNSLKIKAIFLEKINNKTLVVASDYSSSLQDYRNKKNQIAELDSFLSTNLDNYYNSWKQYILPYTFNDQTNQASITVKFIDPTTNEVIFWTFKVLIKFKLTQKYWEKDFEQRLTITPGKIIDPTKPNGSMIVDQLLKWNDKSIYGTSAFLRFDGALDGTETMKINDVAIHVLDNQFTFQMTDYQEHQTNEYNILLEKHDLNDFKQIIRKYQVRYVIKQNVPILNLVWYAWNPEKNPDQRKLIEATLATGERNPNYDPEVNSKTGTKTQIVWVKQKAINPFPLDPLDKNGDIITNGVYDQGFIAEGSVSDMGISQMFDDPWIKSVARVEVDNKTLKLKGNLINVRNDKDGSYFSLTGTYLYIVTDQKGITTNKFIIIGQKWRHKYAKFLEVLNNSKVVVSFWNTMQGFHLKNYLVQYKQLNSKNIQNLSFEKVVSYWKEYVSDLKSQHIGVEINPNNIIDLQTIEFEVLKINSTNLHSIRSSVISHVCKYLNKYDLEYNIDYQIIDLENNLFHLLDFDDNNNAFANLVIIALDTSTKARNVANLVVRNSKNYDVDKVVDLSKIIFDIYQYNFSDFTSDQLKKWILEAIDLKFQSLQIKLVYLIDYHVSSLDIDILDEFIKVSEQTNLIIIIKSDMFSNLATNSTNLVLINDPGGEIAPLVPIVDQQNKRNNLADHKSSNCITNQENLIIMSIIVTIVIVSLVIIIFLKYRFKRGIGGKKIKRFKKSKVN